MYQRRATLAELLLAGLVALAAGCATGRTTAPAGSAPLPLRDDTARPAGRAPATQPQTGAASSTGASAIIRGQDSGAMPVNRFTQQDAGSDQYTRGRMPVTAVRNNPATAYSAPPATAGPPVTSAGPSPLFGTPPAAAPSTLPPPPTTGLTAPGTLTTGPFAPPPIGVDAPMMTPLDVWVDETQTGRFMFGVGVNSDAGVTGQIVLDERNFDITRVPSAWSDFVEGTAFRGRGQGFRLEAMPGTEVQRYLGSFTEPYLFDTPISMTLSGFLYDRSYFDWREGRAGGRVAFGYRLTHDLSISTSIRGEQVEVSHARVVGLIPALDAVIGYNDLFSGRVSLTHDTRDFPFAPTEGHLIELSFEQAFGEFTYPRGELDYRKYFLIRERPDGSGRHTLGFSAQVGVSGTDTPIFENYFAGGFSTLRGFDFRGASPSEYGVRVGGRFKFIGSTEYVFPLTADDMLKGAFFVDFGTVEQDIAIHGDNFRVAPGFGVRLNIPAMGPAPLAFDFAFPVCKADTDDTRVFSFFVGVGR